MQKIKLTPVQNKNLAQAFQDEANAQNQRNTAQALLNNAANYRQSIFEMILEAHGIDPKKLDPAEKFNLSKEGYLTIGVQKASERIKNSLNKNSKHNGHAKVKA